MQHLFARVLEGACWQEASRAQFGGAGWWGNGAAMRVAPAGVAAADLDLVADLARRSAAVTHAHPLGQDGAAVQAWAVALAAASTPGTPVDRAAWCGRLAAAAPGYAAALRRAAGLVPAAAPGEVAAAVGHGMAALEAVPAALAGARCGASALPPTWLYRLEFAGRLIAAADRLAGTAGKPGGPAVAR